MRAGRPRSQGMVIAAWCAMRMTVSREHQPSERGVGKPGFPIPSPGGRVWEGLALPGTTYVHPVRAQRSGMEHDVLSLVRICRFRHVHVGTILGLPH